MNQPDLQMQYLHRKLRIQPVAGNSNFHNMLIHTKSFQIQIPNTKKKNTNWKRTKNTTFFWAIENRCRKLCQFCPPWKLSGDAANDNLFCCQFLPFVCFLFCYILSIFVSFYIFVNISVSAPVLPNSTLGAAVKVGFHAPLLVSIYTPAPSCHTNTQNTQARKYTNTQIRRYPKTQERKYYWRRLSRSAVSTYSQTALILRFCHTNCIYWQYNCSKE